MSDTAKGDMISFMGHEFTGVEYVGAIFQTAGPKWDVISVLFIDGKTSSWRFVGRTRIHVDDKVFESSDEKLWFDYAIDPSVRDEDEASDRVVRAMKLMWRRGGVEAIRRDLVPISDFPYVALDDPKVDVVPVMSYAVSDIMAAATSLKGANTATKEQAAKILGEDGWAN